MATLSSMPVLSIACGVSGSTELPTPTHASEIPNESQERCRSRSNSQEIQHIPTSPVETQIKGKLDISTSSAIQINTLTDPESRAYAQSSRPYDISHSLPSSEHLPAGLGYLSNRRNARASSLSTPTSSSLPTFTASSM
jgi:hypothetical protein